MQVQPDPVDTLPTNQTASAAAAPEGVGGSRPEAMTERQHQQGQQQRGTEPPKQQHDQQLWWFPAWAKPHGDSSQSAKQQQQEQQYSDSLTLPQGENHQHGQEEQQEGAGGVRAGVEPGLGHVLRQRHPRLSPWPQRNFIQHEIHCQHGQEQRPVGDNGHLAQQQEQQQGGAHGDLGQQQQQEEGNVERQSQPYGWPEVS